MGGREEDADTFRKFQVDVWLDQTAFPPFRVARGHTVTLHAVDTHCDDKNRSFQATNKTSMHRTRIVLYCEEYDVLLLATGALCMLTSHARTHINWRIDTTLHCYCTISRSDSEWGL